mmetsp:Transcript_14167/g.36159  ORF Transcript_14167/g.36159 Transcript_14167/m.36159 type:complete len:223 (+) Transcript_14167:69-737(+)
METVWCQDAFAIAGDPAITQGLPAYSFVVALHCAAIHKPLVPTTSPRLEYTGEQTIMYSTPLFRKTRRDGTPFFASRYGSSSPESNAWSNSDTPTSGRAPWNAGTAEPAAKVTLSCASVFHMTIWCARHAVTTSFLVEPPGACLMAERLRRSPAASDDGEKPAVLRGDGGSSGKSDESTRLSVRSAASARLSRRDESILGFFFDGLAADLPSPPAGLRLGVS